MSLLFTEQTALPTQYHLLQLGGNLGPFTEKEVPELVTQLYLHDSKSLYTLKVINLTDCSARANSPLNSHIYIQ